MNEICDYVCLMSYRKKRLMTTMYQTQKIQRCQRVSYRCILFFTCWKWQKWQN